MPAVSSPRRIRLHGPGLALFLSLSLSVSLAAIGVLRTAPARAQSQTQKKDQAKVESSTAPVARPGNPAKLHEAFLKRARKGGVDLLFLGDSITRGWSRADEEGEDHGPVWDRYYRPRHAANFGIGGDRTQHVLWRIQNGEIDGIKPRVVVLMIGTNNVRAHTADEIAEGIEAIVKTLREKLPATRILLLGVFPRDPSPSPRREKLAAVNARIAKLDDGKTLRYLDIGKNFMNEDGTISREIMPDFLHLSRKGYRIWADAMEPTLWSMLDEERVNLRPAGDVKSTGETR
jgi:lysophospholipase L1-like esterase